MFGLMRAKKCGLSAAEKNFRRLNYCGTCKTIGTLYGQKSRFLLNYDTVFLAELLTAISDEDVQDRQRAYQSYNCLSLPKEDMPLALQFAATANIILTRFKLADHIADEGKGRYKLAGRLFSKEFQTAEKLLESWGFPLENVRNILAEQEKIEAVRSAKSLDEFAAPTAQTTGIFFSAGAKLVGRKDLEMNAFEIGFAFGKLIYLIDAFEDYQKDLKTGHFNAIQRAFNLREGKINSQTKRKIVALVSELENRIIENIYQLPISVDKKQIFSNRLSHNLQQKLKTSLPVVDAKKMCRTKPKPTISARWQNSLKTARELARNYSWQMPFVFLFILAFAFVAPAQSREAKSARECFDLSFNLMFLGAIFGSVLMTAKPIFSKGSGRIYPEIPGKPNPGNIENQEEKRRWCESCDCDCDFCDCCCDGCDGCDCCSGCCDSCDGCDCCGGCCDGCSCDCG